MGQLQFEFAHTHARSHRVDRHAHLHSVATRKWRQLGEPARSQRTLT
jgi:hypothetical protein